MQFRIMSRGLGLGLWCLTPLSTFIYKVLLVEETGVPREHLLTFTLYLIKLCRIPSLRQS